MGCSLALLLGSLLRLLAPSLSIAQEPAKFVDHASTRRYFSGTLAAAPWSSIALEGIAQLETRSSSGTASTHATLPLRVVVPRYFSEVLLVITGPGVGPRGGHGQGLPADRRRDAAGSDSQRHRAGSPERQVRFQGIFGKMSVISCRRLG